MKKITLFATLFCLLSAFSLKSQWTDDTDFNQVMVGLQEFNGEIFIAGGFTKRNSANCYWSARYNGSSFTNQSTGLGGGGLRKLEVFNGEIYATGSLDMSAVVKWTGSSWTSAGFFNSSHTGIFANGNDLYVGSDFGVVSKKTGTGSFSAMPTLDNTNDNISAINKYNGDIIIAGNLNSFNSVALNNIAKWDGVAWQPLGTGVSSAIRCMAVYNSELYVGGSFSTAGGQPAKYIAKWNGTSWSNVSGSVTTAGGNGIRDMVVHNNMLFVVGDFTEIGGVPTRNVAMWDGISWNILDLATPSSFANCVEVFNNRLYVGTFDFTEAHLYSRDLSTVAINDIETEHFELDIYPNPSSGTFNIELGEEETVSTVEVLNALGRTVFTSTSNFKNIIQIDIQNQPKGIYIIKVIVGNKIGVKKVILK